MSVITRFAPSPTGYLNIGGARTALFNYLFARHHQGQYLLRIEDTDKQRSTEEAVDAIIDGLSWLGLKGDAAPVFQSAQIDRHSQVATELLNAGNAYRCYLSDQELNALRDAARAEGKPVRSPWRDKTSGPADTPFVVRLKMPDDGETTIEDLVQGPVTVKHQQLDDLVLVRSDGTPTYMLAVVVDDHDMGVTHILRGDDHLNNAFRQQKIYEALGWNIPVFGHIPLIHGPDGAKLSKRHGALGVEAYRDMGYLPDAICNYLSRLGWSHGDDEIFSMDDAISWFDGSAIGKAPARFDFDKLAAVNGQWMREADPHLLAEMLLDKYQSEKSISENATDILVGLMPHLTERAKTLDELLNAITYLVHDGAPEIEDAAQALLDDTAKSRLLDFASDLPNAPLDIDGFKSFFQEWLGAKELKMKDMGLPLRAAITGTKQSPSILDIIVILGPEQVVQRIQEVCN